jgi:hypothetical protein
VLADKAVETAVNVEQQEIQLAAKDAPKVKLVQLDPVLAPLPTPPRPEIVKIYRGKDGVRYGVDKEGKKHRLGSCLVAGTPVCTERGLQPVEQIQPGDLVLAQHPLTGELAYKPVLKSTVRPKVEVLSLKVGDETIRATGGHPFWVLGQGWVRTRMLEPGMRLFSVHGSAPVEAVVDEGQAEPTYNLIVADSHSYFVSQAMILSHDNTLRQPTLGPTPGLAAAP